MIDNFLGIDTEGVGDTGHYGFCHILRHAVMILFFFIKDKSSLQYFITQGMGWVRVLCSLPFALYVILGGGLRLWVGWEEGNRAAPYLSIMKPA